MRVVIVHTVGDDGFWRFHVGVIVQIGTTRGSHRILYFDTEPQVVEMQHYDERTSPHWFVFPRETRIIEEHLKSLKWGKYDASLSWRGVQQELSAIVSMCQTQQQEEARK